jgi:hypothetical protein
MTGAGAAKTCPVCGDKLDDPGASVCYGCRLDRWIPPWYPRAEAYEHDRTWGHANATRHPPTGRAILDDTPPRLSQIVLGGLAGGRRP